MNYWHLQMYLPYGRGKQQINSVEMLQEHVPVIGTGDWDDLQCEYFKNHDGNGLKKGDVILVREGALPLALCVLVDDQAFKNNGLESKYLNIWFRCVKVLKFYNGESLFPQPRGTLQRLTSPNTSSYEFISKRYKELITNQKMKTYTDILKYKKQIVLQGPPGTGKTRLAKEIARELIFQDGLPTKPVSLTDQNIVEVLKGVNEVKSVQGKATYKLSTLDEINQVVKLEKSTGTSDDTKFSQIKAFYQDGYFNSSFHDNDSRRAAALANYIFENIKPSAKVDDSDQFKIIQFHPSYTYEDFVRGIVVQPNEEGTGVLYKSESKVLGKFAVAALQNLRDSAKAPEIVSNEGWVRNRIKDFQQYLEEKLSRDEKIWLTPEVAYITRVTNDTIRYKGDKWKLDGGVPYDDLEKMFLAKVTSLSEIRELSTLTLSAKSNTTYWHKLLLLFDTYLREMNAVMPAPMTSTRVQLKNYVLIIDEINRANLSSVLGELIYALEYRDHQVESMYEDEKGINKLELPSNLYIIGTMNTADRSVGHIDYAIRRRFAFVDVLPKVLNNDSQINFFGELFEKVTKLFTTDSYNTRSNFMSSEFHPKDVALGHSYFIQKIAENGERTPEDMNIRLEYEIKPILYEYVKDGILKESCISEIGALTIEN